MTSKDKWGVKKGLPELYNPRRGADFEFIEIPPLRYFMIDGEHGPNSRAYEKAVIALYRAAYSLKFISKLAGVDYAMPPLEGLWWAKDYGDFVTRNKKNWLWTLMILIPPFVETALAERVLVGAQKDGKVNRRLRIEELHEGLSAQVLHVGSYEAETPVLHRLHHELLPAKGYIETGHHHEIYLSDPRRTAPEKLKTILRQPVKPAA